MKLCVTYRGSPVRHRRAGRTLVSLGTGPGVVVTPGGWLPAVWGRYESMGEVDVLVDGDLAVRPMGEGDFATMAGWLSDPRVLSWFGGRDRPMSLLDITAKYTPRLAGTVPIHCLIAEYHGMPVGYLQFYRWRDFASDAAVLRLSTLDNPYGVDLFVGRPELWGAGLGTRMLRLTLDHLFGTLGARRVALSAMSHNYRAQRAYQKAGFRRVRLVPDAEVHEGIARDEWLMVADRNSYAAPDRPQT